MAESSVGSSNSTIDSSIAKTSIAKTGIAKTMVSIRISISTIKDSSLSISISLSLALLTTTWDRGSQVVSADSNIGGVGQASGGSNHSVSKSSISQTVIASIAQTVSISKSVGVSISSVESISFSLRLGISITLAISYGSIGVARISQGSSSTGHRYVSTVHTGGGLATKSMETIGKGGSGGQELWLSLTVHGSNEGRCDNKELIHFVR